MADDRGRNVLAATLIAGMAGAVAGVLFAPRSGKETRAKLQVAKRDMQDKAGATWGSGKARARGLKNRLTSVASETGRKVKEGYDETGEDVPASSTGTRRTSNLSK